MVFNFYNAMKKNTVLFSVTISILLHIIFFTCSATIKISGIYNLMERSRLMFKIKTVDEQPIIKEPASAKRVSYLKTLKFKSPILPKRPSSGIEDERIEKSDYAMESGEIGKPVSVDKLKDLGELKPPADLHKKAERKTRKEMVEVSKGISEDALMKPLDLLAGPEYSKDFFEKMPGVTPKELDSGIMHKLKEGLLSKFIKDEASPVRRIGDFTELEEYLVYTLDTYEDPADGKKYYKITIHPGKDVDKLKRMAKEIVFVIDCSLSIQRERLEEFKEGILYCLKNLNPDDVFNIMVFKENVMWFKEESVKPDQQIIKEAMEFVGGMTAGEGTDAYKALLEAIQRKTSKIPSYVVLFSDGCATYGITDSRRIINEISKINQGTRPIFVLSGGVRVNRYLLDFISYKNRAWSEYAPRAYTISEHISAMYGKIKDPTLLNVRYLVNGLNEEEIFPKTLPDFYRYAEFRLYGTYGDEDEFSLQILGDIDGEINEFIVVDSLKNAQKGNRDIAREWVYNKIYHLIGLLEYDKENKKIIEEINSLCNKFKIQTPYSEQIKR